MSSITDYTDRNTCILLGDAAAAVLLDVCPEPDYGFIDFILRTDGIGRTVPVHGAGGSLRPPSAETVANREHFITQEGPAVFKVAVIEMSHVAARR